MKIRIISVISAFAIFTTVLSGCGGKEQTVSDNYFYDDKYFYVDSDVPLTSSDNNTSSENIPDNSSTGSDVQSDNRVPMVNTTLTDEQMANNISNTGSGGMATAQTETSLIFGYDKDWAFNHGAYINYFNGKFYAFWQQGRLHEDSCGQHIVYSTSADGKTWTKAQDFIPIKKDKYGNEMLSSPYGTYVNNGKLIVYVYEFGYDPNELANAADPTRPDNPDSAKKLNKTFYTMYTTDGVNWKTGEEIGSGGGNRDPKLLPGMNRLFWAGFDSLAYSDDITGLTGWVKSGPSLVQIQDAYSRGGMSMLTEAAVYRSTDNAIHLMMRSNTQYLWVTTSRDNGKTWGDIYRTNFTDDCQKFDFLHLPDGRILYIGTPGYTGYNFRMPLVAAISSDGYNFDKQYIIGNQPYEAQNSVATKLGNYSYPSAMIKGDYVYVIYAKQKEIIEVTSFKWTDLK